MSTVVFLVFTIFPHRSARCFAQCPDTSCCTGISSRRAVYHFNQVKLSGEKSRNRSGGNYCPFRAMRMHRMDVKSKGDESLFPNDFSYVRLASAVIMRNVLEQRRAEK